MRLLDSVWLWRLGAITTAIYALVFVVDFGIHLHEGWTEGARQRDRILEGRRDCQNSRFGSAVLQERCAQIRAAPLVVPWHVAFHHVGRHLAAKMTSALQSLVVLVALLVPVAAIVFWCVLRSSTHPHRPYFHQHPVPHPAAAAAAATMNPQASLGAFWTSLASAVGSGSSPPRPANVADTAAPKTCVVHLPATTATAGPKKER